VNSFTKDNPLPFKKIESHEFHEYPLNKLKLSKRCFYVATTFTTIAGR